MNTIENLNCAKFLDFQWLASAMPMLGHPCPIVVNLENKFPRLTEMIRVLYHRHSALQFFERKGYGPALRYPHAY